VGVLEIEFDRESYDTSQFNLGGNPFTGLTNFGATCSMNSILQQLFHFAEFRNLMMASALAVLFRLEGLGWSADEGLRKRGRVR
jgi:uncharacterized UBP type Zn finger protein